MATADASLSPSGLRVKSESAFHITMVFFFFCLIFGTEAGLASEHKPVECFPLAVLWEKILSTKTLEDDGAAVLVNLPSHMRVSCI